MNQGVFEREQVWKTKQKEQAKKTSRQREILAATVAVAMTVAFFLGHHLGSAPVAGLQQQVQTLSGQVVSLDTTVQQYKQHAVQCRPYDDVAGEVRQLVARGAFGNAASVAELYLGSTHHPACPGSALIPLWYTASLDALYATPVGSPLDQTPVLRWEEIEAKATRFGLGQGDQASALTVFTYAYANGIWSLARATFIAALQAQLVSVDDRPTLAKYYATLRNMGHILAFEFGGRSRTSGLQLLATANAIGTVLQRGEAAADLTVLLGPNTRRWPQPDRMDPVLAALGH